MDTSTIGHIIRKYDRFFESPIKPKRYPGRRKHLDPYSLIATKLGELIETDVKHLLDIGNKCSGFYLIDPVTK